MIALLVFYHYTGLWQRTNQPHATVAYVMKGLRWGKDKVRALRLELRNLGLIEDVSTVDQHGRKKGWYVRLSYFHPTSFSDGGVSQRVESKPPNAFRAVKKTRKADRGNAFRADTPADRTRSAQNAHRELSVPDGFDEEEKEVIDLYHQTVVASDSRWRWRPIDEFRPSVRKAIADWLAEFRGSTVEDMERLFVAVVNGHECATVPKKRTLVRLLYENLPDY